MPSDPRATLVFLHGRYGAAPSFELIVRELSRTFRCLSVELPGFGGSFFLDDHEASLGDLAELVLDVVGRLDVDPGRTVWLGHDIGGALAQLLALRGERGGPAGLVLVNSACLSLPLTGAEHDLLPALSAWGHRRRLRLLLKYARGLPDEGRARIEEVWAWTRARGATLRTVRGIARSWPIGELELMRWAKAFREFRKPVLVLWGRLDPLNPPDMAALLMRTFPAAELFEHDGCGHWPCLEEPGWVLSKLRQFLFRLAEVRSARKSLSR